MSVREALEEALSGVEVKPQDAALVALARDAAATVDADERRAVSAGGLLLKTLAVFSPPGGWGQGYASLLANPGADLVNAGPFRRTRRSAGEGGRFLPSA